MSKNIVTDTLSSNVTLTGVRNLEDVQELLHRTLGKMQDRADKDNVSIAWDTLQLSTDEHAMDDLMFMGGPEITRWTDITFEVTVFEEV